MSFVVTAVLGISILFAGIAVAQLLVSFHAIRSRVQWNAVFFPASALLLMNLTVLIDLGFRNAYTSREYLLTFVTLMLAVGEVTGVRSLLRLMRRQQMRDDENAFMRLRYERLFKGNDMPILVFEYDTLVVVDANASAEVLFGIEGRGMSTVPFSDLGFEQDVRAALLQASGEAQRSIELRRRSAHDTVRDLLIHLSVVEVAGSHLAYGIVEDVTERNESRAALLEQKQMLAYLADHDALTGLPNRRVLDDVLERAVARGRRGVPATLFFIDVDEFKLVNDRQGHQAGDAALVAISRLLINDTRTGDVVVRLGGDEFAILLEGMDIPEAAVIARRLASAVRHRFPDLGLSIGVASVAGAVDMVDVIRRADQCMYAAKDAGGNQVIVEGGGEA